MLTILSCTGQTDVTRTPQVIANIVRTVPMVLPQREQKDPSFNCRVWVREALRVLQDYNIIHRWDIDDLEKRSFALGTANDGAVVIGHPYQVHSLIAGATS